MTSLLFLASAAIAAPRTVCFNIKIADDRNTRGCAEVGEDGARRGCDPGANIPALGQIVELWDKDPDGNDDYIGTWRKANEGRGCATFDWEALAVSIGETNPDVYVKLPRRVADSDGAVEITQIDYNTGAPSNKISFRAYEVDDCAFGDDCQIVPGGSLVPSTNVASNNARMFMALDSLQHTLEVFADAFTKDVTLVMPCDDGAGNGCTIANSPSDDEIQLKYADGNADPFAGPHELGHSLHKQRLDRNNLVGDCVNTPHTMTLENNEGCVTKEGFANFVYAASLWNDDDVDSVPRARGYSLERARPNFSPCSYNSGRSLAVTRAFWDLADANNEASVFPGSGDDSDNKSEVNIVMRWDSFDNGTANRKDHEGDPDGVNMRDYYWNNTWYFGGGIYDTLLSHNCLQWQDDG